MHWMINKVFNVQQKLIPVCCLLVLLAVSGRTSADAYLILSLQAATGQSDLKDSSSLMTNVGLGLESSSGVYLDWSLGLSGETLAEILLDDDIEHDENKQRGQMDLLVGYKFPVSSRTFMKIGVGIETAIFDKDCHFNVQQGRQVCLRKHEHGPTYKLAYLFKPRSGLTFGLEYSRDELSERRKYNGLALIVNSGF